jgi:hypothetical protein
MIVLSVVILHFSLFCFSCGSYPVFSPYVPVFTILVPFCVFFYCCHCTHLYVHHCWYPHRCSYFLLINYMYTTVGIHTGVRTSVDKLYVHHCWYPHRCNYFLLINYMYTTVGIHTAVITSC